MDAQSGLQLFATLFVGALLVGLVLTVAFGILQYGLASRGVGVFEQVARPAAKLLDAYADRTESDTTARDAARKLGLPEEQVRQWMAEGRITLQGGEGRAASGESAAAPASDPPAPGGGWAAFTREVIHRPKPTDPR